MRLSTMAEGLVRAPRAQVFDAGTRLENLPRFFRGYGPIPGLLSAELVGGGPLAVGVLRRVKAADGAVLEEEILAHEPPARHVYALRGLKPPFSLLVREGRGTWLLDEVAEGTRFRWTYEFELRSVLAWPLARVVLGVFMRRALQRAIGELARLVEGGK